MMLTAAYFPNAENFGRIVVNYLAIAGGFLIGALLSGMVLQVLTRMAFASKVPPRVLWIVRLLGGVALAWLVALFVFGSGSGTGWGFGSGDGSGTNKEGGGPNGQETRPEKDTHKGVGPGPGQTDETVHVEVLGYAGGERITDGKFYRIEKGERLARDEAEDVLTRIQEDRRAAGKKFANLEILIYRNSPDKDTRQVKDLTDWATQRGITPKLSLQDRDAP